ncbi:MAG: hypothetical protein JNK87_42105 [Bryobacterales bacterium]|nr:hypothetical protein [Bryobacterales bacterium]
MFPAIEQYLHQAGALLTAMLLARLVISGLAKVYLFFSLWLGYAVTRSLIVEFVKFSPRQYFHFWIWTEVIAWCLTAMVVLEIGELALAQFPGIRTWGRRAVWTLVLLSMGSTASLAMLVPEATRTGFFYAGTIVQIGLGLALLLVVAFLLWYTVPLSRNVALHTTLFTAYFFSKGAMFLWMALLRTNPRRSVSMAVLVLGCCLLVAWIALLRRQGEHVLARSSPAWSHAEETHMVRQLQALAGGLSIPENRPINQPQPLPRSDRDSR